MGKRLLALALIVLRKEPKAVKLRPSRSGACVQAESKAQAALELHLLPSDKARLCPKMVRKSTPAAILDDSKVGVLYGPVE